MSLLVVPLEEVHLEDAAELAARRYAALRRHAPEMPVRYEDAAQLLPRLRAIAAHTPGVAALDGNRLVGFLAAWMTPSHRGRPTVYSPEWANAAEECDAPRIYQEMYTGMAGRWVSECYLDHFITLYAHDRESIDAWQWLGFGYAVMDGIRDLSPVADRPPHVDIRRVAPEDVDAVLPLWLGLSKHLASAPTFLVDTTKPDPGELRSWLCDAKNALFVAYEAGEAVACLGLGPASDDACTVIRDEGTSSIRSAFTRPDARGHGVASALLDRALSWARAGGYQRCAVDFESTNVLAARFWPRYFRLVCHSLGRHINDAFLPSAAVGKRRRPRVPRLQP